MAKIRVGVAGYGTIGQRLADGVAMQGDMELVGVADLAFLEETAREAMPMASERTAF